MKTEDDAVHRAISASCATPSTVQVKITQGNEPSYFRSMFNKYCPPHIPTKNVIVHNGGAYCGKYDCINYQIINKSYKVGENCIYQVCVENNDMSTAYAIGKPKLASSLNSQDCFVLLNEGMALLWMGKDSSEDDRAIAHYMAGLVSGDPLAVLKMIENQNEMEEFWVAVGGRGEHPSVRDTSGRETMTVDESEAFIAEGWEWKSVGKDYSTADLVSSNVLVLDAGFEGTFVWVGAEKNESTGMFYKAVECLDSINAKDSETRPVVVVNQNFEHALFKQLFKGFGSTETSSAPNNENNNDNSANDVKHEETEKKNDDEVPNDERIEDLESAKEAAEEEAKKAAEDEEAKLAEETAKKEAEEEANRIAAEETADRLVKEVARKAAEEEANRIASEEEAKKETEEEAAKITAKDEKKAVEREAASVKELIENTVNETSNVDVKVGTIVKSIYGQGVVKEVRSAGEVVIEMTSWELAGGQKPTAFLQQGHYAVQAMCSARITTGVDSIKELNEKSVEENVIAEEETVKDNEEEIKAAEELTKEKAAAEAKKAAEEEAARVATEEEAAKKKAEEETAAAKKAAEEEAAKRAVEEAAKKAEEEAAKKAKEEETAAAKKAAEEEAAKKAEEEAAKKANEEETAAAKKAAEEETARKELAAKKAAEEEAAKKTAEAVRVAAEEEATKKAAEAAAAKKVAEEEAAKKAEEEKKATEEKALAKKVEEEKKAAAVAEEAEEEKKMSEEETVEEKKATSTTKDAVAAEIQNDDTSAQSPQEPEDSTKSPSPPSAAVPQSSSEKEEKKDVMSPSTSTATSTTTNSDQKFYSLEELKKPIDGVEWSKREEFLSENDFMKYFGTDKSKFAALALWKRQSAKKKVGIF